MPSGNPITPEEKFIFLDVYAKTRQQSKAAAAAGRSYVGFYELRKRDKEFAAYDGVKVGKFYQGKLIATEREYSDRMLQFLLERGYPGGKYAPQVRNEVTGKDGAPLIPPSNVSENEIARRVAFLLHRGTLNPEEPKPEEAPSVH